MVAPSCVVKDSLPSFWYQLRNEPAEPKSTAPSPFTSFATTERALVADSVMMCSVKDWDPSFK